MRSCEQYEALISAWIDGDLSEAERTALMEHTAVCPRCQQYLDDQLAIHEAITLLDAEAPEGFCSAVMERIKTTPQDKPEKKVVAFPIWQRWVATAACCAVAVLGVWFMGTQERTVNDAMVSYQSAPTESYSLFSAAVTADSAAAESAPAVCSVPESAADSAEPPAAPAAPFFASAESAPTEPPAADGSTAPVEKGAASNCRADFACCLTTGSENAKDWVETTLGEVWTAGGIYPVTAEQYGTLKTLLTSAGEVFTEETGTGSLCLIQAE